MSKRNKNKKTANNKYKEEKSFSKKGAQCEKSREIEELDIADYLAFLPGFLMCVMIALMLILDIALPGMAEKQYEDFPNAFTALDYVIIAGGILYIGISAKRRELRLEKPDVFFAAFALLIMLSTIVNGFNELIINGVPYRFIGILNMFAFMLIYMGVTRSIKRESFGNMILAGYLIVADLVGLASIYDIATGGIEAFHDKKELSAIFFNGNHYGYFIMMALLIGIGCYIFGNKIISICGGVSAGLNLLLLGINHSLGCILSLIVVLVSTGIIILIKDKSYKRKYMTVAAVLMIAFIVALLISSAIRTEFTGLFEDLTAILSNTAEGSAGHRRLQMWTLTAGYIAEKPLLGYGCEGIAFMLYDAMKVSNPHCEALTYAAYYGIPAALLYMAGAIAVIVTCIRRTSTNGAHQKASCMAAAGYFISSFVGVGMFYTLPFFFIFLGLSLKREQ